MTKKGENGQIVGTCQVCNGEELPLNRVPTAQGGHIYECDECLKIDKRAVKARKQLQKEDKEKATCDDLRNI